MMSRFNKAIEKGDKIIAIIGPVGCGKSTLIDQLTGTTRWAGTGLNSVTQTVRAVRVQVPGVESTVVLVDTPGFDDSTRPDTEIPRMIGEWLEKTYKRMDVTLTSILYLHRITDNRMTGSPHRSLRLVRKLCGTRSAETVIFVTTMWDKIKPSVGEKREEQLKTYWKAILDQGATTARFNNELQRGREIIRKSLEQAQPSIPTLMQEEMVDLDMPLNETQAAHTLYTKLQTLLIQHKATIAALESEAKRASNQKMMDQLETDRSRILTELNKTFREAQTLKIPLSRRIRSFYSSRNKPKALSMEEKSGMRDDLTNLWDKASRPKVIKVEDLSQNDVIIAVMGPTGSGKSSFIETVTGQKGMVGHDLQSCTSDISVVKLSFPELSHSEICFVDTPGFDDTNRSDADVFEMISKWLNDTYKKKIDLNGLLYFHRISDNRMNSTAVGNLHTFQKLYGEDFSHIILTTTMWDEVDEETGGDREKELSEVYWSGMINCGSIIKRFRRDRQSAFQVLAPIIDEVNKRNALYLQHEMADLGRDLRQTTAGRTLYSELEDLVSRHQKMLKRIRRELQEPELHSEELQGLMDEYETVSAQLQRVTDDMKKMEINVGERLRKAVVRLDWGRLFG